ncbi:MAG: hypothetical protein AVDCRST_MAG32-1592 [uncultured Nocardioides sp.]|uniref:Uncharacterized protein n=1 Tax=uncultured Nocardioides sp. TaxID=198441 RepID=A0A6J4NBN2_9ACTN|nr:MAG: hypothetical protein AVDCRST_MAG32-1592 [uncultured Nocardioides sp.]
MVEPSTLGEMMIVWAESDDVPTRVEPPLDPHWCPQTWRSC